MEIVSYKESLWQEAEVSQKNTYLHWGELVKYSK